MTEMVDIDNLTQQQVYSILGTMPAFDVGQVVVYSQTMKAAREVTIIAISVQYGKIVYTNDAGKWGFEIQYKPASVKTDVSA